MRKRIFEALNLEEGALNAIEQLVAELQPKFTAVAGYDIRFVSRSNWHLTMSFLGYQEETDAPRIIEAMRQTAAGFGEQEIIFKKLSYGPPGRTPRPPKFSSRKFGRARMIWLLADIGVSRKLAELKTALEDNLEATGVGFGRETRPFAGHLTLARMDSVNPRGLPAIERDVNIRSAAGSLDLMESELRRGGAEYTILQKVPFR